MNNNIISFTMADAKKHLAKEKVELLAPLLMELIVKIDRSDSDSEVKVEAEVSWENLDIEEAKAIVKNKYPKIWISTFAKNKKTTVVEYEAHIDNMCNIRIAEQGLETFYNKNDVWKFIAAKILSS